MQILKKIQAVMLLEETIQNKFSLETVSNWKCPMSSLSLLIFTHPNKHAKK